MKLRINKPKTADKKHVTITAVWVKTLEMPEPIAVPMTRPRQLRKGDTLSIDCDFNDFIGLFGTEDVGGETP